MLELKSIECRYDQVTAVHGASLSVQTGEVVALLGSNGAGKSTLLRAVSGVQPIAGGQILFDGTDLMALSPWKRVSIGLAHVPEGRLVFGGLSVEDNLRLGASTSSNAQSARMAAEMYSLFPILADKRRDLAASLSGGQQQFLAIARALMSSPRLLMLDEPSMGLAPKAVAQVYEFLGRLKGTGTTVLLVEQNAQLGLSIADRAYVMVAGEIAFGGEAQLLVNDARLVEAYLGA
jgi:branched-chain amino acid transport system ATP-binding protein